MSRICVALALLVASSAASAADVVTLRGMVLQQGSNRPIVDAVVFVIDDDRLSTSTDDAGYFDLDVPGPGNYAISAVAVGYARPQPITVSVLPRVDPPDTTFYLLAENSNPDIVVYRERSPNRVAKTVITSDSLRTVPGSAGDLLKGLQALPGVLVGDDASSAPAIRGSRPEDNLYFVDDLPVGYLFHLGGVVSVFNSDLADNFNLYAAAFGPEYGDATGAVIDVALRNPRTDRWRRKFNISLFSADAMIEGPATENQSFFLSARRSYFDLLINKVSDQSAGATVQVPNYYDYQGKYAWRLNSGQVLTAHVNGAGDAIEYFVNDRGDLAQRKPQLVGASAVNQGYDSQALTFDSRRSADTSNRLSLGQMVETANSIIGTAEDGHFKTGTWYLREQYKDRVSAQHEILAGVNYSQLLNNVDLDKKNCPRSPDFGVSCDKENLPRAQYNDQFTVNLWEAYARDRWLVVKNLTFTGGLRLTQDDYLAESFVEPRLGVEWDINANTLITAGWGRYHQFPAREQVIPVFGNPNLRHIRAEHSVLGIEHTLEAWSWKVEAYYKGYDRMVLPDAQLKYRNGGSGHAYGVETLVKKTSGQWTGWTALSLSKSIRRNGDTGESFPMDYDQPVNLTTVINWQANARWLLGMKWTAHSGNPYSPFVGYTNDVPSKPQYGDTNSARLPNYHRLDLRAECTVPHNTWMLRYYFDILNAYNRNNVAGYHYNSDYTERTTVYQLPLIPSFGVQVEF